jgi:phosphocarrier protein HPr
MHARPAAEFVKLAGGSPLPGPGGPDSLEVDGKSIMGVLMLAAEQGAELTGHGPGEDAPEAVEALVELVDRGFGEA